jgi:hypothetical protein
MTEAEKEAHDEKWSHDNKGQHYGWYPALPYHACFPDMLHMNLNQFNSATEEAYQIVDVVVRPKRRHRTPEPHAVAIREAPLTIRVRLRHHGHVVVHTAFVAERIDSRDPLIKVLVVHRLHHDRVDRGITRCHALRWGVSCVVLHKGCAVL